MLARQRIAFFLPSLSGGGAERVLVTLANSLCRRGYAVDFVLCARTGPYLKDLDERVNVVDLKARRVLLAIIPLFRYLREAKPQALVSSLMHSNVVAAIATLCNGRRQRLIIREANTLGVGGRHETFKGRLLLRAVRWAYRRADALVGVSQGVLEQMTQVLELPAAVQKHVILNPVIEPSLREKAAMPPAPEWPWSQAVPTVLGVGRLVPAKGFSTLLDAIAIVNKVRPARLIILGEGPERHGLETQVRQLGLADQVWMPGFVDNPFAHMRQASAFVLSSRLEGLPNVLIQAMACHTPVVATRCPSGPAEILENGRLGALVEMDDAQAMAQAILDIFDGSATAKGVSDDRYDVEVVTSQYEKVIFGVRS